jgi:hypothetical protein
MADIKLEPCPFCGNEDLLFYEYSDVLRDLIDDVNEDIYYDYADSIEENFDGYVIKCRSIRNGISCYAQSGWGATMAQAADKWNNRISQEKTAVVFKRKKGTFRAQV